MERALINLLDNSLRFSPPHSVVTVTTGKRGKKAYVSVEDQGVGIDPINIEMVFDRYYSTSKSSGLNPGIGLALVKQVGDAHSGVTVISPATNGKGACFTLWFEA